jgi:predicted nucleic acid-binding protein
LKIYADTSFFVSLYGPDANLAAAAARTILASSGDRFVSVFGELEVLNAMGLRVLRKEVSAAQAQSSLKDFEKDLRAGVFQLRPLTEQVFERARQLSRRTRCPTTLAIASKRCDTGL